MAVVAAQALARLRREPLEDCALAGRVEQLCRVHAHHWRDRLLTPVVTVRLMLLQVLHGNTAITHLRQLCGLGFAAASYCEARGRLPLLIWQELVQWVARLAAAEVEHSLIGVRVLIADCSSFSMSDTPDLRHTLDVHAALQKGDVLLGDRAYCSFGHLALLHLRGVLGCFRLHQRRKDHSTGEQRWTRGPKAPAWLTSEQWLALPQWLDVRIVSYNVSERGFRTQRVMIATTLLDAIAWPDAKIAELYGHRWRIETCFDHLKTTMRMNVLKCQTVDGVMKRSRNGRLPGDEIAAYLLVYNLVRLAMLHAAARQKQSVWRISFIDALRWLSVRMMGLGGVDRLIENPLRPGRHEPRVIRRRMKEYDLMTKPRNEYGTPANSTKSA